MSLFRRDATIFSHLPRLQRVAFNASLSTPGLLRSSVGRQPADECALFWTTILPGRIEGVGAAINADAPCPLFMEEGGRATARTDCIGGSGFGHRVPLSMAVIDFIRSLLLSPGVAFRSAPANTSAARNRRRCPCRIPLASSQVELISQLLSFEGAVLYGAEIVSLVMS